MSIVKGKELMYWEPLCYVDPTFDYGWGMLLVDDTNVFSEGPKLVMWRGGGGSEIYLYDIYSDGLTYWVGAPWSTSSGAGMAYCPLDRRLYMLRGNATADFARLDLATMTWTTLTSAPATIGSSGTTTGPNIPMVHPCKGVASVPTVTFTDTGGTSRTTDHYIFVARGSGYSDFWIYDITNNVWGVRASLPWTANRVSLIWAPEWNAGKIIAIHTESTRNWAVYDIATNTWTSYTYGGTTQTIGADWSTPVYTKGIGNKHWIIVPSNVAYYSLAIDIVANKAIVNVLPRYFGSPNARYPRKNTELVVINNIPYLYLYAGYDRRATFARCPLYILL